MQNSIDEKDLLLFDVLYLSLACMLFKITLAIKFNKILLSNKNFEKNLIEAWL